MLHYSLEEYLHDLVGHIPGAEDQLTIDGPSLNFAQAALVLQNSSNIYSRKVEYLYALVYKSLEENFQVQNGKVVRQRHADPDIDDFFAFDPYQEFLLLDDVLPTDDSPDNRKIDLVEEKADGSTPGRSMTRLSLTENKSVTAINDVAYKTLLDPHGSTLRLLKAPVAEDGWLRLPGTNSGKRQSLSTTLSPLPQTIQDHSGEERMEMQSGFGVFDGGNDNVNDDDDGPGFFMNGDEEEVLPVATQQMANDKPARHVTFAEYVPTPKRDPWALLDPHSVDSVTKAKPLKVGKSIRLPEGITEPPSACVTGARTRRIIRPINPTSQADTATGKRRFDATESFNSQCAFGKRSVNDNDDDTVDFLPLQGLAFGDEFTYVHQATAKRFAAQRRELRQQEQSRAAQSKFDEEDDDDQYGDGFVFGGDDDNNDSGDAADHSQEGNTGMVSFDEMYNRENGKCMQLQCLSRSYQLDRILTIFASQDDAPTGATFEELCRAHLQAFAREAEKYASETKLTQRVDQWQQRLQPLLQEEEERPVFDIHEYGHQVIESMADEITRTSLDTNEKPSLIVDFSRVTRHKPNFEVCRLFLASLSLTNSGNVRFVETSTDGNSLSMELLNREVDLPTENYLAPSVRETSSMVV